MSIGKSMNKGRKKVRLKKLNERLADVLWARSAKAVPWGSYRT